MFPLLKGSMRLWLGSWTAYLISVLYVEYRSRKEKENVNFKNHVIRWFEVLDGLLGPYWKAIGLAFNCTFLLFGSVIQLIACASNIYYINDNLDKRTWTYIFGAWKLCTLCGSPESSNIFTFLPLYVFTLTLLSSAAVYWEFGDELFNHSNAFSLLPKIRWRDAAVIFMLIHQFITFGFACTPLYFVWEKVIGMHVTL
ncbi:putative amino acid transporter, transmembrane domain-containing protein [Helianthus annuus]|nr:putative amino acid transporter, transmembrane domain-containing protein [Helianthus annuus]